MASSMESRLKELTEMLNIVLIQTGKVLRDTNLHTPQNAALASRSISKFVAPANDAFNNALSDIEVDILQAKSAIERDLSIVRKRRAERDREAGPDIAANTSTQKTSELDISAETNHGSKAEGESEDALMVDASLLSDNPNPDLIDMKELSNVLGDGNSAALFDNMPQDSQNNAGLAISMPQQKEGPGGRSDPNTTDQATIDGQIDGQVDPLALTQQSNQSKETSDFDFDTMFNDAFTGNSNDLGFGDSSNTISNANNILGENSDMSAFDLGNTGSAMSAPTNEDINSLLPGLENFVNGSNDVMVNSTEANIAAAAQSMQQTGNNAGDTNDPQSNQMGTELLDSSFDDLIGSMENLEGDKGDADLTMLDGDINFEPFDDDWFKTDT